MRFALALILLALVSVAGLLPVRAEEGAASDIVERTRTWLSRLPANQRGHVLHAYAASERRNWHYVPRDRSGLALRSMGEDARREALGLFASVLDARCWAKAKAVFRLEAILQRQAVASNPNTPRSWRDPLLYFVSVFGSPSSNTRWGMRLEGHHLSVNLTFEGQRLLSATPLFFGASPASARMRDGGTLRPLGREEDLAIQLVNSLDAAQRRRAVARARVPGDIRHGPGRPATATAQGIPAMALTAAQQAVLRELVDEHRLGVSTADAELHAARFTWMGGMRAGQALYYQITSPTFLIEHRNLGSHVHTLWRDPRGDFGGR